MTVPRPDDACGVYGISVAAELVGMGVQNLRMYEARGLLEPERTEGGTRRYSANDLDRLRRIGDLLEAGLNLAGIAMVLALETENDQLRADKEQQRIRGLGLVRVRRRQGHAELGTPGRDGLDVTEPPGRLVEAQDVRRQGVGHPPNRTSGDRGRGRRQPFRRVGEGR